MAEFNPNLPTIPSVVFTIINKNGEALVEHRINVDPDYPNDWIFPGEKLEGSERPSEGLLRGLQEEFGIQCPEGFLRLSDYNEFMYTRGGFANFPITLYLVSWTGYIPDKVLDTGRELGFFTLPSIAQATKAPITRQIAGRIALKMLETL